MMNWIKERPLIGTEGLTKDLHSISSTDCWFIQSLSQGLSESMSDGVLDLFASAPPQIDSFVQVGVPIRAIVEGLLVQGRSLNG